jgi:hypothetical protein
LAPLLVFKEKLLPWKKVWKERSKRDLLVMGVNLLYTSCLRATSGRKCAEIKDRAAASFFLAGSRYFFLMINTFYKLVPFQPRITCQQKCLASEILVAQLLWSLPQGLNFSKLTTVLIFLKTFCWDSILDTFNFEIAHTLNVLFSILDISSSNFSPRLQET